MKISFIMLFVLSTFMISFANAQLKTQGPFQAETGEYRFPSQVYKDILEDRETEIWARVFWPKDKKTLQIPDHVPLIILLHGNHGTCGQGKNPRLDSGSSYTQTGKCPDGQIVTPNHEGYNYFAEELSSYGYVVVSINANRGITAGYGVPGDGGLNLARGRLILKHLSLWKEWSTQGGQPESLNAGANAFVNKINFSQVGLFGHSRGGEGVRAAYNLYNDTGSVWQTLIPELRVKAIFEVGAVDGQTDRTLDANGVVWNQLIPVCDGDVSDYQGIRPFNRMINGQLAQGGSQKSVYLVYGANHNFFNTEWQESDSYGCTNHTALWDSSKEEWKSEKQQEVGLKTIVPFFRANVGSDQSFFFNQLFNPVYKIFTDITKITQIERDYAASQSLDSQIRFDDFNRSDSSVVRTHGENIKMSLKNNQDSPLALIEWSHLGSEKTIRFTKSQSLDVSKSKTFDFRFSLLAGYNGPRINFNISLIDELGQKSTAVSLSNHSNKILSPARSIMFETVRIPMSKFKNTDLTQIKSVEIELEDSVSTRSIYLANLRFSFLRSYKEVSNAPMVPELVSTAQPHPSPQNLNSSLVVKQFTAYAVKKITSLNESNKDFAGRINSYELTFSSNQTFKIRDAMPILKVGLKSFDRSMIDRVNGKTQITFLIPKEDISYVNSHKDNFKIYYQGNSHQEWLINSL